MFSLNKAEENGRCKRQLNSRGPYSEPCGTFLLIDDCGFTEKISVHKWF